MLHQSFNAMHAYKLNMTVSLVKLIDIRPITRDRIYLLDAFRKFKVLPELRSNCLILSSLTCFECEIIHPAVRD